MRASTFQSGQNGLRINPRDLRVSSGGVRLTHQAATQSEAGAFVQALMERYKSWQTCWVSLDLVLRQRPSSMTMPPLYHQVQMHVAPRLHLTVRGETHVLRQRSIERVERTLREQFVQYLGTRGKRIEAVATPDRLTTKGLNKAPSPGMSADLSLARPVSRVVRRPVTASVPADRRLLPETATTLPEPRSVVASRTSPPAPAPIDVHRLTDQVIQAIDRRIIAQRERLGRI
jgi:hypothetical protein